MINRLINGHVRTTTVHSQTLTICILMNIFITLHDIQSSALVASSAEMA